MVLPTGVTSVSSQNVAVTSLISPTGQVRASPEPTLLLAEDAGGTVLLSIADMDGGLLGEGPGDVDVSIHSTAITLVALAAGTPIHAIDQRFVDQIQAHAHYPALVTALTERLKEDKNFLDRLFEHSEVVALIRQVAGASTALEVRQRASAQTEAVPPEGVRYSTFASGSPWRKHAPWQWFGEASLATLSPPFLARSVQSPGTHASGNPNFIDYALEVYSNGTYQDWYYIPGNGSLWDKGTNSYAAHRLLPLDPTIDEVRFERYRLSADSPRAVLLSLVNSMKMLTSVVGLLVKVKALEDWLKKLPLEDEPQALVSCAVQFAQAGKLPPASIGSPPLRALMLVRDNSLKWLNTLRSCIPGNFKPGQVGYFAQLDKILKKWVRENILETVAGKLNPLGWTFLIFEAVNEVGPRAASYLAPSAGSVEYHLAWKEDGSRQAYIVCASTSQQVAAGCLSPAPTNLRVDAVNDTELTLTWDAVQGEAMREYVVYEVLGPPAADDVPRTRRGTTRERQWTIGGLAPETEYCFSVTAVNSEGAESEHSAHACGKTHETSLCNPDPGCQDERWDSDHEECRECTASCMQFERCWDVESGVAYETTCAEELPSGSYHLVCGSGHSVRYPQR